jgi:hypothetical protein
VTINTGDSVSATVLNTEAEQHRAAMTTNNAAGQTLVTRSFITQNVLSGTNIRDRSALLLLDDDAELIALMITAFGETATTQTITGILDVIGGSNNETSEVDKYMQGSTISSSVNLTSAARLFNADTLFQYEGRTRKIWLKRGRLYRLSITNSHAATTPRMAQATVALRMRRRR